MTAYWVNEYRSISDPDAMARYAALAAPAIQAGGGRFLVRGLPAQVHEAGLMERTVVIEFPDLEAAIATHDGPAYQAALKEFNGAAERDLRIVPGAE